MISSLARLASTLNLWIIYLRVFVSLFPFVQSRTAFESISNESLPLFRIEARRLRHVVSGAEVMLLLPEDETPEKSFGISFRTPVKDNKGIPHVLEHAVLGGSRKYPVSELIFPLQRMTTATYLNAVTYADKTVYPFSVLHPDDLLNIASVYLDSVFDPLCLTSKEIFSKNAWHYELDDLDSLPSLTGVVLNEMRGAYSEPEEQLKKTLFESLFANTDLQYFSGGVPEAMSSLTYEELLDYYFTHYVASNAKFAYYGGEEVVDNLLQKVDEYLKLSLAREHARLGRNRSAEEIRNTTRQITWETSGAEPKCVYKRIPADPQSMDDILAFAMRLGPSTMPTCDLQLLSMTIALMGDEPTRPLWRILEESKIAKSVSGISLSISGGEVLFGVVLKGISQDLLSFGLDFASPSLEHHFEDLIQNYFQRQRDKGFSKESVAAKLNHMDFSLREASATAENRGIALIGRIFSQWNLDQPPLKDLRIEESLSCMKSRIANDTGLFPSLIDQYFVRNLHRVVVRLGGDTEIFQAKEKAEKDALRTFKESLSSEAIEQLVEETRKTKEARMSMASPEQLATLPRLPLSAISRKATYLRHDVFSSRTGIPLVVEDLPTAGIAYVTHAFDLSDLTMRQLHLLYIAVYLYKHGPGVKLSAEQKADLMETKTGGISLNFRFYSRFEGEAATVSDPALGDVFLDIEIKCLIESFSTCYEVLWEESKDINFSESKWQVIVRLQDKITRLAHLTTDHPFDLAISKLRASMYSVYAAASNLNRQEALSVLQELLERATNRWEDFVTELVEVWDEVLQGHNLALNIAADKGSFEKLTSVISETVDLLPRKRNNAEGFSASGFTPHHRRWAEDLNFRLQSDSTGYLYKAPLDVNYNVIGGRLTAPGSPIMYGDEVAAALLEDHFLIHQLRILGQAYGAFLDIDSALGTFTFASYRDPQVKSSFATFLDTPHVLDDLIRNITQEDIDMLLVAILSGIDKPVTNPRKAQHSFQQWMSHITEEDVQRTRNAYFAVKPVYLEDFARRFQKAIESPTLVAVSVGRGHVEDFPEQLHNVVSS